MSDIEKVKETMGKLVGHLKSTRSSVDMQTARIDELEKVLTTHSMIMNEIKQQVESLLASQTTGAPRLRSRPLNKKYNTLVQECLDEDPTMPAKEISEATGIPKSTVYKYLKLTPEEASELPDE